MNRSLKLPLLVALALGSGQALAMDLGQIQVKSSLGQPLLAEIPVQQATAAELQQLSVQLASGDASGRIPLHFAVVDGVNGHKVIRITSETVVNDPFLDLLVEIHGGTSKSVREFTILLDPPGNGPLSQPARPRAGHAMQPAAAPMASAPVASGQWRVQSGQNLSTVARKSAPAGVDVNQMMLALKQANPDAFYRDNINALKAGAVLRIPSKVEAEAVAVAVAAAAEEVRRENGDWRNGPISNAPTSVADAGTRAGTSSSPTAAKASAGDHLALVPAKQGGKSATDNSGALRQDLQRTEESLANLQQQSTDLKSRLKDLSDLNSKNQRLLALKDNEIAELQQKLAAARKSAGMPAAAKSAVAAEAVAAAAKAAPVKPAAVVPAPAASAAPASSATAVKPAMATASTATAPAASSVASPAKAESVKPEAAKTAPLKPAAIKPAPASEAPWYTQLWAQALGGAVLLLLLLGWLLGRRKAKPASSLPKLAPSLADRFGGEPSTDDANDDVDQNLLLDQLAEHPDDVGLHLELVSLYYGRRDIEHFEAAAEAMHAHVTDPQQEEWRQVVRMGEDLVPAHPLFADHGSLSADEHAAHHGFDIDQYAAEQPAAPAPVVAPPMPANPVTVSEYNFNFDLTPSHDKRAEDAKPAAQPAVDTDATVIRGSEPKSAWQFDEEPVAQVQPAGHDIESREYSDDPVDTKLDLARAYLDMGDPEGARAMLEEVLHEGSQVQRDVAKRLLDDLH